MIRNWNGDHASDNPTGGRAKKLKQTPNSKRLADPRQDWLVFGRLFPEIWNSQSREHAEWQAGIRSLGLYHDQQQNGREFNDGLLTWIPNVGVVAGLRPECWCYGWAP